MKIMCALLARILNNTNSFGESWMVFILFYFEGYKSRHKYSNLSRRLCLVTFAIDLLGKLLSLANLVMVLSDRPVALDISPIVRNALISYQHLVMMRSFILSMFKSSMFNIFSIKFQ